MSGILSLPDEILTKICIACDFPTLFNVAQTSKRFYACFSTEVVWRAKWDYLTKSQGVNIKGNPRCKFKDMCRRYGAIFGFSPQAVEPDCLRCRSSVCEAQCYQDRDELIIFDFGSKTTWFKYASETTGQLSMHPTVGPSFETTQSAAPGETANVIECCPICIKFAKRKTASMCDLSSAFPEVKIPRHCHHPPPHRRGLASAFSKLSLRNLQCFDGIDSDDESEVPPTIEEEKEEEDSDAGDKEEVGDKEDDCPRCPDYVAMYKFLMKHMLRRNPFFQVKHIPFVICEPSQNDCPMMVQMVKFLLTELKIPAVCFIPTPIAVSLYTDLETCLVIDSGANNTVVTPVVGQRVVEAGIRHSNVGGHHVTQQLIEVAKTKGITYQIDEASLDSSRVKKECYLAYSTTTESQKNIARKKIEVKVCRNGAVESEEISLSHELYLVAEDMYLHLSLPSLVSDSLTSVDAGTRKRLLGNIVLTGGNCRLAGLSLRLTRDLQQCYPLVAVRVLDPRLMTGRTDAVIGASYIRKWAQAGWVTRRDFILWGPTRCLEKTEIV